MATYFELAHIANNVYGYDYPYISKNIPNWFPLEHTVSSSEKFKSTSRKGLFAWIYENFATKECVLAIKGTNILSADDLKSDFKFAVGTYMKDHFIPELQELMQYMFQIKVHYPEHNFTTITGHSLGGILAKMAAAETEGIEKVLAFNSPGVQAALKVMPASIYYHPNKVETIITFGDDVGNFCKTGDIGRYIEISNIAGSSGTRALERVAAVGAGLTEGAMAGFIAPGVGNVVGAIAGAVIGGAAGEILIENQEHKMGNIINSMKNDYHHNFNLEF